MANIKITELTELAATPADGDLLEIVDGGTVSKKITVENLINASSKKMGAFTYDVSTETGAVAIAGVGFKPSAIIFMGQIDSTVNWGFGLSDGITHGGIAKITAAIVSTNTSAIRLFIDAGNHQIGVINSFDADGFTIGWTKTGSPTGTGYIKYLAFR